MRRFRTSITLISATVLAAACASIISGTSENVSVTSDPLGATVLLEPGGLKFTTPVTLPLKRKDAPYLLTFTLAGYKPYETYIHTTTNNWVWGNLLLGGLIGLAVDFSNGAATALTPKQVQANLEKVDVHTRGNSGDTVLVFASDGRLLATVILE